MKTGFAGRWSPLEKSSWSGTYYYSYQAIKKYSDTEILQYKWPWYIREQLILHKQLQKLKNKKVAVEFLKGYAKWFSKQLEKDLKIHKPDILFVPAAPQLIAYCHTPVPVIFMTDATFSQIQGYYDSFDNLAAYNIRQGIELDKSAFGNAAHCMLASEWTKQSAMKDYSIAENKITVAPLGANLDTVPDRNELKKEKNKICRLLFLGVEWERKGGDIALNTLAELKKNGMAAHLTIIGCTPPGYIEGKNDYPDITVIPFINKHNTQESKQLYDIIRNSDFLLLPTRAECAGVVFCEASAFGIPSISTDTGGVSTYVENGVNGFTLPLNAGAMAYAEKIQTLFNDDIAYYTLAASSRKKFEEELNWDAWGKTFNRVAQQLLNK